MLETIKTRAVALRALADLDIYETAVEQFESGGSRHELLSTLFSIGIPATQIRHLASYPGSRLPAIVCE
ncbi:hypothetical protein [Bradyrhizobium guangdongense]